MASDVRDVARACHGQQTIRGLCRMAEKGGDLGFLTRVCWEVWFLIDRNGNFLYLRRFLWAVGKIIGFEGILWWAIKERNAVLSFLKKSGALFGLAEN
ncbi:hypothetical protein ACLOJK_011441 [Asimina triloba]